MFEYKIDKGKTSKAINNILDIACLVANLECQNCPIRNACDFLVEFQKTLDK